MMLSAGPGHGEELGLQVTHLLPDRTPINQRSCLALKQIKWALTVHEERLGIPEQCQGSGSN